MKQCVRPPLTWVLERQRATLLVFAERSSLTALLFIIVPKGFFPVQDTGVIIGVTEAPQTVSFAGLAERQQALVKALLDGPCRREPLVVHWRGRHQRDAKQRPAADQPQADRRAVRRRQHRDPPSAVAGRDGIGHHALHAGRPGPEVEDRVSRTQYQYSLEHPDQAQLDRGPAVVRRAAPQPTLQDVATDQQIGRRPRGYRHRSRHRVATRHQPSDGQHAVRRLRPAPGIDHLHAVEPVPRRAGAEA